MIIRMRQDGSLLVIGLTADEIEHIKTKQPLSVNPTQSTTVLIFGADSDVEADQIMRSMGHSDKLINRDAGNAPSDTGQGPTTEPQATSVTMKSPSKMVN